MLNMYPYPSGSRLHVGHGRNYILGDALYRRERMAGRKALNPMGWDAFGLPAENAAIQSGVPPREYTLGNIARMKEQLNALGLPLRLVQGARLVRSGVLPLEPVALPADVGAGPRVPQDRSGQLVPGLPDGAGQRAGRGRPLRALRRRRRDPRSDAVVLPGHRLRRAAARGPGQPAALVRARQDDAAQLDRALRGRRDPVRGRRARRADHRLHDAARHALRRDASWPSRPSIPPSRCWRRARPRPGAIAQFVDRVRRESRLEREAEGGEKEGLATGAFAINPGTGEKIPVWLANFVLPEYGTGAIMGVPAHDQRDFEFARQYGLPIRPVYRTEEGGGRPCGDDRADPPRRVPLPVGRVGRHAERSEAIRVAIQWLEQKGVGQGEGRLPAARLAHLAAALLGHADPGDPLSRLRSRARAGHGPARPAAGGRGVPGRRGQSAREVRGVRQRRAARAAAVRRAARRTRWTRSSTPPGTTCGSSIPHDAAQMVDTERVEALAAGRPVHRRHRARDPAPALRAVHLPGAEGHGPRAPRGAVRAPLQPGDDHAVERGDREDREDVQVARQHGVARRADRALRRRHRAALHALHRASREGVRVVGGRRGRRLSGS